MRRLDLPIHLPNMFGLDPAIFWFVFSVTAFAGFVKGAVGFAMPMIMMSAFGSVLSPQLALAALILPTLATNILQAGRGGIGAAWDTVGRFRWHIGAVIIFIVVSAAFVRSVPQSLMYLLLGIPIVAFAIWQLSGRPLTLPIHHARRAEIISGMIGGLYGGISGIWGPPLIVYLLSINVSKSEQMRVQGVVFLMGAVVLTLAHLASGVLNAQTLPLSAVLVVPGVAGMFLGLWVHDRLNVDQFRRWTLVLLVLSGLNLVRRGVEILLS
ncbi:sulfite exporter TauE/SafE family protein [Paracoccus aerodenitrificans]|uniref:sulfite exporter TauE/SafE family protein n=1 Tax=Paracoccus aerodenitrificans TaxID=3017781 RepID=UPI0022F0DEA7|nr:sulfite exporter TauE/SafE family protein [Paracoccus aerodenitrificans]WBU64367.1 sulfite exporter TauE/SafE family protein [Paracoccus aerodenitrificans]